MCSNKADSFFIWNIPREVYEERIARYRKIFLSNKEYYCQSPLAQKLLSLQAEKEEIECRIKACDDQITRTQTELDRLTGNRLFMQSQPALFELNYLELLMQFPFFFFFV